jgi:hypothetical protein
LPFSRQQGFPSHARFHVTVHASKFMDQLRTRIQVTPIPSSLPTTP